jgi:hypothetical protein
MTVAGLSAMKRVAGGGQDIEVRSTWQNGGRKALDARAQRWALRRARRCRVAEAGREDLRDCAGQDNFLQGWLFERGERGRRGDGQPKGAAAAATDSGWACVRG